MNRRHLLAGLAALPLAAGCARHHPGTPSPTVTPDLPLFPIEDLVGEAGCLTCIEDLTPRAVLDRAHARVTGRRAWPENGWASLAGRAPLAVLAVTRIERWALMVEESASITPEPGVITRLSRGTRVVSNYHNFEADDEFTLAENGVIQVGFAPKYPTSRTGKHPDLLLPQMREAGFVVTTPLPPEPPVPPEASALALTERIIGVRLTPELLYRATYLVGTVVDIRPPVAEADESPQSGP